MTWEGAAALLPLLPVLAIPGWSLWRVARGLRAGDWRRPGWFGHLAWASFFLLGLTWLSAASAGGLDMEETCQLQHHQPYDRAYHDAHHDDYFRVFPLSLRCNADYDLVGAWVNPTVAGLFLLCTAALTGLGWTLVRRVRQSAGAMGRTS